MGVFEALKACIEFKYGSYSLKEKSVLVKGIGGVGKYIVDFLNQQGARLYITDIDYKKIEQCKKEIEAIAVSPEDLLKHKYDIICPCDINYTVTPENIDEIDTDIIVGATNNQLSHPDLAGMLAEKNILYCPDYVANSGGLIYVTDLYEKKPLATLKAKIENIYSTALNVFQLANKTSITTKEAADRLAQNVIDSVNRSREINYAA
jgi:leucine dehydrogenase